MPKNKYAILHLIKVNRVISCGVISGPVMAEARIMEEMAWCWRCSGRSVQVPGDPASLTTILSYAASHTANVSLWGMHQWDGGL